MPKKTSTKPATNSRKNTSSKTSKKKKVEATTDTAWEKLASTPTTSPSKTSKTTDKFPWESMPIRLDIKKEKRICWFECEEHLNKLIIREKLTPQDYVISTNGVKLVGLPKQKRRKNAK